MCHNTIHIDCRYRGTKSKTTRNFCSWCSKPNATLVCPLCRAEEDGVFHAKLCQACSDEIHVDHKLIHKDHLYAIQ
ncbi:hypothetical protein LSAT2_030013 [Lamellibrachia satsuma]|nr:hypothetical protein LSAT2_030013 [Lamellibrachia satsuma]